MTELEPPTKRPRHPRNPDLDHFLAEVRATRQTYLGLTEHFREARQEADYDTEYEALDNSQAPEYK